jgi:type III secretion protein C
MFALGLGAAIFAGPPVAAAASVTWRTKEIASSVQNMPIGDVLRDLASTEGLRVSVDPSVGGRVSLDFRGSPTALLSRLEASHGLQWYFDGSVMYFTRAEQHSTAVLRMPAQSSTKAFESMLARLGIADGRFPLRVDPIERLVIVSGPPRYVELVREAARANGVEKASDDEEVRVFTLRYGWAKDRTVQVGNESMKVSGIANLMNAVFHGAAETTGAPTVARSAAGPRSDALPPDPFRAQLRSTPGGSVDVPAPMYEEYERVIGRHSKMNLSRAAAGLPQIHADSRLNAVIVRDVAHRMDAHERFIRALDVRPRMIELHLRIIDAETSVLQERQLGTARSEQNAAGSAALPAGPPPMMATARMSSTEGVSSSSRRQR